VTTLLPPIHQGAANADTGVPFIIARERMLVELQERWNILTAMGVVSLRGDLAGTGTTVMKITRMTGAGFAVPMDVMASETAPIVAKSIKTGFDTLTLGRHGISHEITYQQDMIQTEQSRAGIGLEALAAMAPDSWLKTMRQKVCVAGAGIVAVVGDGATKWSFDDELDGIASFHGTEGFEGQVVSIRHPDMFRHLRESIRDEPAYQFPETMSALQGLQPNNGAFNFLGLQNHSSFDVTQLTGAHQGFAYAPDAIGYVTASTTPIPTANPGATLYIPQYGMIIEWDSTGRQAFRVYYGNAWFGVALLTEKVYPQYRYVALDD